jgi:hypothetical protein
MIYKTRKAGAHLINTEKSTPEGEIFADLSCSRDPHFSNLFYGKASVP